MWELEFFFLTKKKFEHCLIGEQIGARAISFQGLFPFYLDHLLL